MDKINIYVPKNIGEILCNDAVQFEFYKKDGFTVNKNRFLNQLVKGYYDLYMKEASNAYNSICSILGKYNLDSETIDKIGNEIVKDVIMPELPARKGKNPQKLSLKPTKDTVPLIKHIMDEIGTSDYISQFFCRMLMSYCEKPFSERERILFREFYDFIQNAIVMKQSIRFMTIWNLKTVHDVIPYKIVVGKEEMYNYLLCGEINKKSGKLEAKSYRLNRLCSLGFGHIREPLSENILHYLKKMCDGAPQFAINSDLISCVRLTKEGCFLFNKIYYGRPNPLERRQEGDYWLYYFNCSIEQLYQYFKRFDQGQFEVLEPKELALQIKHFHDIP